jgi:hypothetical protein
MMRNLVLLVLPTVVLAQQTWNRPNSLLTNTTNATAYGCDAACQELVDVNTIQGDRLSFFDSVPYDADFYATSPSFSASTSQPGDLLKLEPFVNITKAWKIPSGTTLYRFQYVSLDPHDHPVPVTGFIAFPWSTVAKAPDHRYHWISYAHGTFGTHYGCAVSSTYNLYDDDTIRPLLLNGYAVVGTDYQGQGNNYTQHPYLDNKSQGTDTYFAAVAAKKAFPDLLGNEWASSGHSQGGGAVWGLVESKWLEESHRYLGNLTLHFVGGVALEPAMRPYDEFNPSPPVHVTAAAASTGSPYLINFVQALRAVSR